MQPTFDPSKLRLGVADKMDEIPVAHASDNNGSTDGTDPAYRAKATQAAVKFESFFIGHMLHQMRASTKQLSADDSVFKDPVNDDMLDLADNLVADRMASQRAFGIADVILRQLLPPAAAGPAGPAAPMPLPKSTTEPQNLAPPLNLP